MMVRKTLGGGKRLIGKAAEYALSMALKPQPRDVRIVLTLEDLARCSVLVVLAHPDDEIIAVGALLGRAFRAGVICLTTGAPRAEYFARNAGFDNRLDYGDARKAEARAALALLNRELAPSYNVGIADQEVIFDLKPLTLHLVHKFRLDFSHVITHAYEGGHPDHDAAAFCVHAACALMAREGETPPVIVEVPLYNSARGRSETGVFIPHPDAGPVLQLALTSVERDLKQRMIACHATQKSILENFDVTGEKFRQAPRYNFSAPPHDGPLGFDQFRWVVSGKLWRKHARRVMRELDVWRDLA